MLEVTMYMHPKVKLRELLHTVCNIKKKKVKYIYLLVKIQVTCWTHSNIYYTHKTHISSSQYQNDNTKMTRLIKTIGFKVTIYIIWVPKKCLIYQLSDTQG